MSPFRFFSARLLAASVIIAAVSVFGQSRESTSCGSNIVSSTVVATFCGHRLDDDQMLDLLILWRGNPGWFQRRESGSFGSGGSSQSGGGSKGKVSQHSTYGTVTVAFDADFDLSTVKIDEVMVPLSSLNTVLVDRVDEPGQRTIQATRWTEPRLPLAGDVNLILVQRSADLLNYLRCDQPMPAPPVGTPPSPLRIVTVCEKLQSK